MDTDGIGRKKSGRRVGSGYWGKQGPEFLAHRAAAYRDPLRMVLGAKTYASNAPFFPVISGATGVGRVFDGADDFDLELIDARTFDGNTQVLTYRPARHN